MHWCGVENFCAATETFTKSPHRDCGVKSVHTAPVFLNKRDVEREVASDTKREYMRITLQTALAHEPRTITLVGGVTPTLLYSTVLKRP